MKNRENGKFESSWKGKMGVKYSGAELIIQSRTSDFRLQTSGGQFAIRLNMKGPIVKNQSLGGGFGNLRKTLIIRSGRIFASQWAAIDCYFGYLVLN